ncbi:MULTISPECIES: 23S rRNA accumulation protein YceD [Thalassotalea]|uniref:Large ribosomal RNA subunit accumulation protein YceD n=1 Tax=Thalassotalea castellviae TaxID=3075612 RepID=A0ABU2ZW47_9GAMM|nr:23S rRNA accumulation protein YceD [Thalassotalea sp. W431]MDT0602134.1 23S rRNA accumulation protein YceD [Thalassotalea sp. W431]
MQNLKLPITIDPYRSAQRSLECEGIFETSGMNRLLAACESSSEHVHVKVEFGVDELGLVFISAKGSATVVLTCQRCTEAFEHKLLIDFVFSPVKDEEAAENLPSYYDAIELDENGEVNLRDLVEEELLLVIPLIPRHELKDCQSPSDSVWGQLPVEHEKPNPFDVLKKLK